jgi:hypothetical protein
MSSYLKLLAFTFFLVLEEVTTAQVETVSISTDRNLYFTGETVWFRPWVFMPPGEMGKKKSRILYLELLTDDNIPIIQKKVDLWDHNGAGSFKIPEDAGSGCYTLRGYTNKLRQLGVEYFFCTKLILVNPLHPKSLFINMMSDTIHPMDKTTSSVQQQDLKKDEPENQFSISVRTSNTRFHSREKVGVDIFAIDKKGMAVAADLCISVGMQLNNGMGNREPIQPKEYPTEQSDRQKSQFPIETEFDIIEGGVSEFEKPLPGRQVYLSVPGDSSLLFITKTNSLGLFSIPIAFLSGSREIIVGTNDSSRSALLNLSDEFDSRYRLNEKSNCQLDTESQQNLNAAYIRWQIQRFYNPQEDLTEKACHSEFKFYGIPDFKIELRDFAELPNMEEVFFELVKPVMVIHKHKTASLLVIDKKANRTLGEHVLYLLDGIPLTDPEKILSLTPSKIKSIQIVARQYYLGPELFNGIIDIESKNRVLAESLNGTHFFKTTIPFASLSEKEYNPVEEKKNSPAFRNQLYWNSSIKTNSEGRAHFDFNTGDGTGEYTISIEGFSLNGDPIMMKQKFKVE